MFKNPLQVDQQAKELNFQENTLNPDPLVRLVGRANEGKIFIDGKPVTTILDTGSQETYDSYDFSKENGIQNQPINQTVNIEGTGHGTIDYLGYIETRLSLPIGNKLDKESPLLLVFSTTDYHRRVVVAIGTSITDIVINSLNTSTMLHNSGRQLVALHKLGGKCKHISCRRVL